MITAAASLVQREGVPGYVLVRVRDFEVRINGLYSHHMYRDVVDIIEQATESCPTSLCEYSRAGRRTMRHVCDSDGWKRKGPHWISCCWLLAHFADAWFAKFDM